MARKPMIAGNWKMHKTAAEAVELVGQLKAGIAGFADVDVVVCPPFTSLPAVVAAAAGSPVGVGAQNVHWAASGAFTGEIAAAMLCELPVQYAIVGHSERRQYFGETDETVNKRLRAALDAGLTPIVCVGETGEQRAAGETERVVGPQVAAALAGCQPQEAAGIILAYEPVWAIGSGVTPTPAEAQGVHGFIRGQLRDLFGAVADDMRILYGGSVKPGNAAVMLAQPDIDGALVGGASLKSADFIGIVSHA